MCYSKQQSINSFTVNIISCFILYYYSQNNTEYKILALFFGFVGFMQLFDVIFWSNQNIQNPQQAHINLITTKIAMIINHIQPIFLAYIIYIYKSKLNTFSKNIIILYSIIILLYTTNSYNNIKYTIVENVGDKNSLKWDWNYQEYNHVVYTLFLLSFIILSYENFRFPLNIILIFINVITFILSKYIYKGKSIGRFWCKFAAWIPLLFVLTQKEIV